MKNTIEQNAVGQQDRRQQIQISVSDTTDPDRRSQDSSSVRRSHVRVSLDYGKIERDLSTQMAVGGRHYGSGSGSGAEPFQSHKAKRIFQISFSSFELRPQKS